MIPSSPSRERFDGIDIQLFQKVPALKAMAPTQSEPPFLVAQLVAMAFFAVLTVLAAKRFRNEPVRTM